VPGNEEVIPGTEVGDWLEKKIFTNNRPLSLGITCRQMKRACNNFPPWCFLGVPQNEP
jgi:hypothetical protein